MLIQSLDKCLDLVEDPMQQNKKSCLEKIRQWRVSKIFGSMEQLRSLVLFKFRKSEEVYLTGPDHNRIQVFWIPCPRYLADPASCATAIFCGQNAQFAEFLSYNSSLLEFYHSKNINFVTWNYRGCSLSQGNPTMKGIKNDGVVVAQYVRNKVGAASKVIVHGTSIGGAVATFVARKGLCDFVVCDRTFGSLNEVPRLPLGAWATVGLKYLFEWDTDNSEDYYYANCYKIIA